MNPATKLSVIVEGIVRSDNSLSTAIDLTHPAWIDVGVPLEGGDADAVFPCVRIDGLTQDQGKLISYDAFVKLWSQDLSGGFLDLVDSFCAALQSAPGIVCESYLHRPENALNCAVFPVTFY